MSELLLKLIEAYYSKTVKDIFKGSLIVLKDDKNPRRYSQSAHSLREAYEIIMNLRSLVGGNEKYLGILKTDREILISTISYKESNYADNYGRACEHAKKTFFKEKDIEKFAELFQEISSELLSHFDELKSLKGVN